MNDSSYYYSLMLKYGREKRRLEEKIKTYETILNELKKIIGKYTSPITLLNGSYNLFLNGGYYDGGTPTRGKIMEAKDLIISAGAITNSIIYKTDCQIKNLIIELSMAKNNYKLAETKYNTAKSKEQG